MPRLRVLGEMMVNALQRKQAFDDLRTSEERLDRAAAFGRCGLWELDLGTGAIWVTPETRLIYGLAAAETANYDLLMRLIHEADREAVAAAIGKAIAERSEFDETYRIVRPDGGLRWIHVTGRAGRRRQSCSGRRWTSPSRWTRLTGLARRQPGSRRRSMSRHWGSTRWRTARQ